MKLSKEEISRRYGSALFDVANEKQQQEIILQELADLNEVYRQIPDLGAVLTDNRLSNKAKQELLASLKAKVSPLMQNFLQLLFAYRRLDSLPAINTEYVKLFNHATKKCQAQVTTAVALSEPQQVALSQALQQRLGMNQVSLKVDIKPQIIGGVVIQVGDTIIDGSIKTKMQQISRVLLTD